MRCRTRKPVSSARRVPNGGGNTARARFGRRRSGRPRSGLALAIVLGVVVLDVLTKVWAVNELVDAPVAIIGDTVDLRLARNTGGAFSLFQAFTPLLAILAIVVAFLLVRAVRHADDTLMLVALSLVLGGSIGNLIDRLFRSPGFMRGAVVDFVHIGSWPTFNVADSAITIGAVLLVIWAFRADTRERVDTPADRESADE
jgi:signal peptidase II